MKPLSEDYREKMYSKRHQHLMNMVELAAMLNCKHEHIVADQTGKEAPNEVLAAIINWVEG